MRLSRARPRLRFTVHALECELASVFGQSVSISGRKSSLTTFATISSAEKPANGLEHPPNFASTTPNAYMSAFSLKGTPHTTSGATLATLSVLSDRDVVICHSLWAPKSDSFASKSLLRATFCARS